MRWLNTVQIVEGIQRGIDKTTDKDKGDNLICQTAASDEASTEIKKENVEFPSLLEGFELMSVEDVCDIAC